MKAHITLTDDLGNTYLGEVELIKTAPSSTHGAKAKQPNPHAAALKEIDFKLGVRAFLKRYIASNANGHQKFVILLAWITKGSLSQTVSYEDVVAQWNRVKSLTGGAFNPAYTTRAKDANWVDTPKTGIYKLQPDWKGAFQR